MQVGMNFPPYGDTLSVQRATSITGNFVDVLNGQIYPACVTLQEGLISRIERKVSVPNRYILPGLIDSHIHLESTFLTPYRFAEQVVPHGTTCVIASPFRIASVMGTDGLRFMMEDARNSPMHLFLTAPSCVPMPGDPREGPDIGWREVRDLLSMQNVVALGEVMHFEDVINDDPDVMSKIEVATLASKQVDGHCPHLKGRDLVRYIRAGISTDHECSSAAEAQDKHDKGLEIMVKEGSEEHDLLSLWPFPRDNKHFLVSNHIDAVDLMNGHLDAILRRAVANGMDEVHAIRAMTIWPAQHYGIPAGFMDVGQPADLIVVDNLKSFNVQMVYIGGRLVARDGMSLFLGNPTGVPTFIADQNAKAEDFMLPHPGPTASVPVLDLFAQKDQLLVVNEDLLAIEGRIHPDPLRDIAMIASIDRSLVAQPMVGFIRGSNLKKGAIASTATKDPRDIVVIGVDPFAMAVAVNTVSRVGGVYATDGTNGIGLELPVAGLMSDRPCGEVAQREEDLLLFIRSMGCQLPLQSLADFTLSRKNKVENLVLS